VGFILGGFGWFSRLMINFDYLLCNLGYGNSSTCSK
jgi:hypothetical protein